MLAMFVDNQLHVRPRQPVHTYDHLSRASSSTEPSRNKMVDPALTSPQRPLQDYHLSTLPPTGYYIPNFITEQEEEYLLRKVSWRSLLSLTRAYSSSLWSRPRTEADTPFPFVLDRRDTKAEMENRRNWKTVSLASRQLSFHSI